MLERDDEVVRGFAEACRRGDVAALRGALDDAAIAICDGGGVVPAALSPVRGADDVARLVAVLLCDRPGGELTVEAVNGGAGLALWHADRATAVVAVKVVGTRVAALWIVLNPAKLGGWHRR